jgi:uncharacterized protein involved in response to NO
MNGPHWLSCGFRPFFLLGALAMAASVLVWLPVHLTGLELPTDFAPRDWHVHTMLFGGIMAIVAGFALTAVSNWTGRPPVAGLVLLALVTFWIAGRVAVTISAIIGPTPAMIVDLLFPVALATVFAREVIAAGNHRNLPVVAIVAALGAADAAFHLEARLAGSADVAIRAAIALVLVLVMLIGGRIVPAFTRNWLMARSSPTLPAAFSRLDAVTIATSAAALAAWTVFPAEAATAVLLLVAAGLNTVRVSRWRGLSTRPEPLLAILHVAFATVPLGFAAMAVAIAAPNVLDPVAAVHVWTVGTFGSITLAVMARASRGHSGRALTADRLDVVMFALVLAGAAARIAASWADGWVVHALDGAGLAWAAAYLLFVARYAPMLVLPPQTR